MRKRYQVAIVGAGPSAIFAALTLSKLGIGDAAIFERGNEFLSPLLRLLPSRKPCPPTCGFVEEGTDLLGFENSHRFLLPM
jgi:hypothetical protein